MPGRQTAIPCTLMRGGTSKGPFFLASDLPADAAARDRVFVGTTSFGVVVDPKLSPSGQVIIYAAMSGPTGMNSSSTKFCLPNGRPSMIARASATSLVSNRNTAPRPSPREYHSRILPFR